MGYRENWTITDGDRYILNTKNSKSDDSGSGSALDPKSTLSGGILYSGINIVRGLFNEVANWPAPGATMKGDGYSCIDGKFQGENHLIGQSWSSSGSINLTNLVLKNSAKLVKGTKTNVYLYDCHSNKVDELTPRDSGYFLYGSQSLIEYADGCINIRHSIQRFTFHNCEGIEIYHGDINIYHIFSESKIFFKEDPNLDYVVFDKDGNVGFKFESTYGIFNDAFRDISTLRTYCNTQAYILTANQDADNLEFLRQVVSFAFNNNITCTAQYFQNCRMVGAGDYTAHTDIGFVDAANGDYRLKPDSICVGIGYNKENAGCYGIAEKLSFNTTDFPLIDRVNLNSNGTLVDMNTIATAKSKVLGSNVLKDVESLYSLAQLALRNDEIMRPWYNFDDAVAAGGALTDGQRYIVEDAAVTYNSQSYDIDEIVDATTANGLTHTGGKLRPFLDLLPNMIVSIKATQQVFADQATAESHLNTLKFAHFNLYAEKPQCNISNNDIIAGDADISNRADSVTVLDASHTTSNFDSGNAVDLVVTWWQVELKVMPNEKYWRA